LALRDVTEIGIGFDVKEQTGIFKSQSGFDSLFFNRRVTLYIAKNHFFRQWKKLETMKIFTGGWFRLASVGRVPPQLGGLSWAFSAIEYDGGFSKRRVQARHVSKIIAEADTMGLI
jgi:hypothetical protein